MSNNQQTPSSVRRSLVILLAVVAVAVGWFVWQASRDADKTLDDTERVQEAERKNQEDKQKQAADEYKDWKSYAWAAQGVSFQHPDGWVVKEDTGIGRLYVRNTDVDLLKEETPENFEQVWLSVDTDENSAAREDAIKKGQSDFRVVNGTVKTSTIKSGNLTINVYEYDTLGGPTLEAYWANKAGKRFLATTSTEVGEKNQQGMVANLKKLLATVSVQ